MCISLLLQSIILLISGITIRYLERHAERHSTLRQKRFLALVTAIAKFSKSQCKWVSFVQIASYYSKNTQLYLRLYRFLDYSFLCTVGMIGFVQLLFSWIVIAIYGRLSFGILFLSSIAWYISSYIVWTFSCGTFDVSGYTSFSAAKLSSCGDLSPNSIAELWCGNRDSVIKLGTNSTWSSNLEWLIWINSLVCLVVNVLEALS